MRLCVYGWVLINILKKTLKIMAEAERSTRAPGAYLKARILPFEESPNTWDYRARFWFALPPILHTIDWL